MNRYSLSGKRGGKDDEMGTTLVAAWIGADGLSWVSVGDSPSAAYPGRENVSA
ncbi:MAG: hypothetical protein V8Q16_00200 [Akkermansia muciniphila]